MLFEYPSAILSDSGKSCMPAISIFNAKRGTGKTTLTIVLACELARNGASVVVIDVDTNSTTGRWSRRRAHEGRAAPFEIIAEPGEAKLVRLFDQYSASHDFVLIDFEGIASRATSRALARSHMVLVPFNLSPIDAEFTASAVGLLHEAAEVLGRNIPFRLVRSRDNAAIQTKTAQRIIAAITQAELPLLSVGLVERAAYRDIFDFAQTLEELDENRTSGLPAARKNAYDIARSVLEAFAEEDRKVSGTAWGRRLVGSTGAANEPREGSGELERPVCSEIERARIKLDAAQEEAIHRSGAVGFVDRDAASSVTSETSGKAAPRRRRSAQPQVSVFIKGPKDALDWFVEYSNQCGHRSYWETLEEFRALVEGK
jgi:chromosome partitioning protein